MQELFPNVPAEEVESYLPYFQSYVKSFVDYQYVGDKKNRSKTTIKRNTEQGIACKIAYCLTNGLDVLSAMSQFRKRFIPGTTSILINGVSPKSIRFESYSDRKATLSMDERAYWGIIDRRKMGHQEANAFVCTKGDRYYVIKESVVPGPYDTKKCDYRRVMVFEV